jgi:hypothetical protein
VTKRLGLFVAGAAAIWSAAFALAWLIWPDDRDVTLTCSLTALGLCLVPTTLTFLWSSWGLKQAPDQVLTSVLGGTGVRFFFVLGLGLLLSSTVPYLHENRLSYWIWVLVFYLATLALEMTLVVKMQLSLENRSDAGSAPSTAP